MQHEKKHATARPPTHTYLLDRALARGEEIIDLGHEHRKERLGHDRRVGGDKNLGQLGHGRAEARRVLLGHDDGDAELVRAADLDFLGGCWGCVEGAVQVGVGSARARAARQLLLCGLRAPRPKRARTPCGAPCRRRRESRG